MHIPGLFQGVTIKDFKPPKRKDIVKKFVERLHADTDAENLMEPVVAKYENRKPIIWEKIQPSWAAVKMSHMSKQLLWEFYGWCNESKHFSKCWWYSLKEVEKFKKYEKKKI